MDAEQIPSALADIQSETDPTLKHLKLASLVSSVFRERGVELVVVGGSAIEFYTEGTYVSGDVDLCIESTREPLTAMVRQELMGKIGARGGPRSWEVAGAYVDILTTFENLARTKVRQLSAPYGPVRIAQPEELIVERLLVSTYPADYPPARDCALKLLAAGLLGEVETDWAEVRRLAQSSAYQNWPYVKATIHEQATALQVRSPYDSAE
jgi:hypothetical protein